MSAFLVGVASDEPFVSGGAATKRPPFPVVHSLVIVEAEDGDDAAAQVEEQGANTSATPGRSIIVAPAREFVVRTRVEEI